MKKNFSIIFVSLFCLKSFSQVDSSKNGSAAPGTDYSQLMLKSKNQKTAAWILAGGGAAITVAGIILWDKENQRRAEEDTWDYVFSFGYNNWIILSVAGVLMATAGSIPLFVKARRNKKNANALSTSFIINKAGLVQGNKFASVNYPALSLKLNF